jgi:Domain of unknown function (DUF222)
MKGKRDRIEHMFDLHPITTTPPTQGLGDAEFWGELEDSWDLGRAAFEVFEGDHTLDTSSAGRQVLPAIGDARSALRRVADVTADAPNSTDALSDKDLLVAIEEAFANQAVAQAVTLRLIAAAEARGASTTRYQIRTSSWLAHHRNVVSVERARELVRLGSSLRHRFQQVDAALGEGSMSMDQAEAIVATMRKLPEGLSSEVTERAECELVKMARSHNPRDLRMAANLMVELLAPEVAEADAEAAVRRLDAEADAGRSLSFYDDPVTGGVGLRGVLPSVEGAHLRLLVDALVARPRPGAGGVEAGDDRSATQKRADALMEIVHCYADSGDAPSRGSDRPRVNRDRADRCRCHRRAVVGRSRQPILRRRVEAGTQCSRPRLCLPWLRFAAAGLRCAPRETVVGRRRNEPGQRSSAVPVPPSVGRAGSARSTGRPVGDRDRRRRITSGPAARRRRSGLPGEAPPALLETATGALAELIRPR